MCISKPKPPDMSAQKEEAKRQAQAEQEKRRRDKLKLLEDRRAGSSGGAQQSLINLGGAVAKGARSFFSGTGT